MHISDTDTQTPLPVRKICVLGLLLFANNASIWVIFAFIPFMVIHFYPNIHEVEVGYMAGVLGSAFSLGSMVGNLIWGVAADRFGRRPVLLLGLLGTALSAALFGFAPSFWVAVFARFLWGLLNGNVGVGKTYMAEIHDDSNSCKGMAMFGTIGGLGRTFGPIIGGFLSQPANRYDIFQGTVFAEYPFALPCVVIVVFCVVVLGVAYFELTETLQVKEKVVRGSGQGRSVYMKLGTNSTDDVDDDDGDDDGRMDSSTGSLDEKTHGLDLNMENKSVELTSPHLHPVGNDSAAQNLQKPSLFHRMSAAVSSPAGYMHVRTSDNELIRQESESELTHTLLRDEEEGSQTGAHHAVAVDTLEPPRNPCDPADDKAAKNQRKKKGVSFNGTVQMKIIETSDLEYGRLKRVTEEDRALPITQGRTSRIESEKPYDAAEDLMAKSSERFSNGSELLEDGWEEQHLSSWGSLRQIMRNKMVFISTLLYGLLALVHVVMVEIFPLWLVVPSEEGGFGFKSHEIGITIMVSGPVCVLSQVVLYPVIVQQYGALKVFRFGVVIYGVMALFSPFITFGHVDELPNLQWVLVTFSYTVMSMAIGWSFVCVFVLINNSCYSHERAKVNGIGQTMASIGRLIGPASGSALFAWTASSGLTWPFDYSFVWYVIAIGTILIWKLSKKLPRKILKSRREPKVPRYAVTMQQGKKYDEDEIDEFNL